MNQILWQPDKKKIASSNMAAFIQYASKENNDNFQWNEDANMHELYEAVHNWSITDIENFWRSVWKFCKVKSSNIGETTLLNPQKMPGAEWFPEAKLNFAENLLHTPDQSPAIIFYGEDKVKQQISRAELTKSVASITKALLDLGVEKGDRVAAYMPNIPETVIFMLAATSIGAVFSSASPDFGVQGVMDRFSQVKPKILLSAEGYYYNGKTIDIFEKVEEVSKRLTKDYGLKHTLIVGYTRSDYSIKSIENSIRWEDLLSKYEGAEQYYEQIPFNHPLYIMFSSGTTGVPKCIEHSTGGVLLQHLKEHQLHCDLKAKDRLFYYTTCGWMMWNWLVTGLASKASILLYDGSPLYKDGNYLFEFLQDTECSHFGTSAKFFEAISKKNLNPIKTHDLSNLRVILTTGSPLIPESFDYVYQHVKKDVCLSSMSGGTDILSCFVEGNPLLPVRRGEIQCYGLGMDVAVFNENGVAVDNTPGELVCNKPFPPMPIRFLNDDNGEKYHNAYFNTYPNVWCHGDYCEKTKQGGIIIYGRSDATLNPGGVRIGTAEIYRQVEKIDEIVESLVVGQLWHGDERVILFVKLKENSELDDHLKQKIVNVITENATRRHVPAKIINVSDIPRTRSGKIVELAVKNIIHNRPIRNIESIANPEVLDEFANLPELKE